METQDSSNVVKTKDATYEFSFILTIISYLINVLSIICAVSTLLNLHQATWHEWYIVSFVPIWIILTAAIMQKKAWAAIYFFAFVIMDFAGFEFMRGYDSNLGCLWGIGMFIGLLIPHKWKIGWQVLFHKEKTSVPSRAYTDFVKVSLIILACLMGIDVAYGYIHVFTSSIYLGISGILFWSLVILQLYLIYKKEAASYIYFIVLCASYLLTPLITGESFSIFTLCIILFFILFLTIILVIPIKGQNGWSILWAKKSDDNPVE